MDTGNYTIEESIEEKRKRLEELRKLREQRQASNPSLLDEQNIKLLVGRILQKDSNISNTINTNRDNGISKKSVIHESDDSYSESRDVSNTSPVQHIERYDKAVQTPDVVPQTQLPNPNLDTIQEDSNGNPLPSRHDPKDATLNEVIKEIAPKNTITAIKKKITIVSNEEGMDLIKKNMEVSSICSSVDIIERALTQTEESDFMKDYMTLENENEDKKDIFALHKTYSFDSLKMHPITAITVSPFQKNILLVSYAPILSTRDYDGMLSLWDTTISDHPYKLLYLNEICTACCFHPFQPNYIICGFQNGLIGLYDMKDNNMISISNTNDSYHINRVIGLSIMKNTIVLGLVSVSNDGVLCLWNMNNLIEPVVSCNLNILSYHSLPLESLIIPTCISSYNASTSTIAIGSEDGKVYIISIHNNIITIEDIIMNHSSMITHCDIEIINNEWTVMNTSSCDWTTQIMNYEHPQVPVLTLSTSSFIISSLWHPFVPYILIMACSHGMLYLYDLIKDHEKAVASIQVHPTAGITAIQWLNNGKSVAVGLETGQMLLYDISYEMNDNHDEALQTFIHIIKEQAK